MPLMLTDTSVFNMQRLNKEGWVSFPQYLVASPTIILMYAWRLTKAKVPGKNMLSY